MLEPFAREYPSKKLFVFSGEWGCLVATGTQYRDLDPMESGEYVDVILGDPLTGAIPTEKDSAFGTAMRTAAIMRQMRASPSEARIRHPAAIISICKASGEVDVLIDAWGGVPVYAIEDAPHTLLGSSPDLLASTHACCLDRISALERLCAEQISFPNTLYANVKELTPGALTRISQGRRSITKRWTPPLPDNCRTVDEWIDALHSSIRDVLKRISHEVSRTGHVTISAGLDSRFLLSVIQRDKLLDVTAINLSSGRHLVRKIARRIANKMGVPIQLRTRPKDHYSALFLNRHPEIGSNSILSDAHFAEKSLGTIDGSKFLLGGYMADTLLVRGDHFTMSRETGLRSGTIEQGAPEWAMHPAYKAINREDREEISRRWRRAEQLLDLGPEHSETIRRIVPATRQGNKGHFDAARRSYPIYEPFMTEELLELGMQLPDEIKANTTKERFYGSYLESTKSIPANPRWRRMYRLTSRLAMMGPLCRMLLPETLIWGGEWDEVRGPLYQSALKSFRDSLPSLSKVLSVDVTNDSRMFVVGPIQHALERCDGRVA